MAGYPGGVRARRGKTNIDLWDYAKLRQELLSRPAFVLTHFVRCQVESLDALEMYQRLKQEEPAAAARIEAVARELGIPIRLDDLVNDDVLCDKPGHV